MNAAPQPDALDQIFRAARTHNVLVGPVSNDQLRAIYDLMKYGLTSANCSPARIVFLRSRLIETGAISTAEATTVRTEFGLPLRSSKEAGTPICWTLNGRRAS